MSTHSITRTVAAPLPIAAPRQAPTDAELLRSVRVRLSRLGTRFLRGIQPAVRTGIVTLRGQVDGDYERQVVVQLVRQIAGVRDVVDNLRHGEPPSPGPRARTERMTAETVRPFPVRRKHALAALAASLVAATAWSAFDGAPVVPVAARLHVHGRSAEGVVLTLHPIYERRDAPRPRGRADASGRIEWTTYERGDGLPPGEYAVTAAWDRPVDGPAGGSPRPPAIAACYARPETSPLRITVTDDPRPPLELELTP